jgi:EAL domain-containing protein (putative c-di-GMP-specific phosphodiesterase class I)
MLYAPGRYNLNYDISAILLNVIIMIFFLTKKKVRDRRVKLFMSLEFILCVAAAGELGTALIRNGTIVCSSATKTVVTIIAQYSHNSVGFLILLYMLEILGRLRTMRKAQLFLISVPQMILTVFMFVPRLRHTIFYYDADGNYFHGPMRDWLYYTIVIIYLIIGIIGLMRHKRTLVRKDLYYSLFVAIGFVASMITERVGRYLRACVFLQSLCMLAVYVTIENDDETFDYETGLLSRYSLWKEARFLFDNKRTSYMISVRLQDDNYYDVMLGPDITRGVKRQMTDWMARLMNERVRVFYPGRGTFAIELFNSTKDEAMSVAEKIRQRYEYSWLYKNTPAYYTVQVVVGCIPDVIKTQDQLITFVDNGFDVSLPADQVLFADELMKSEVRKADVERALHRALDNQSFKVYYQPIYDTEEGKIRSCEALVRMIDDELGFVSPEEFIKVAEQTGLVSQIGEIVFEKVCRYLHDVKPQQYGLEFVEVNLSTVQCMDTNLPDRFTEIMQKYGVTADQIDLEITESAVVNDENTMIHVLNRLTDMGFSFALDDFGTGNANYSYIIKYPFRLIKIDKSFLWGSEKNAENATILRNMVNLISELDRLAVVEGVETVEQKEKLIANGVRYLQGYYYSKPVPEDDFTKYISDFNANTSEEEA